MCKSNMERSEESFGDQVIANWGLNVITSPIRYNLYLSSFV
jgi:hypothetical protein